MYSKRLLLPILLFHIFCFQAKAQSGENPSFVHIHGNTFIMGEPESEYQGPPGSYDAPEVSVTLTEFWMSKTEISNEQYALFLNAAFSDGLIELREETNPGPDLGRTLVFGTSSAPYEYRDAALTFLEGTRVMKDHDDGDGDGNPFTGDIEPENPLNLNYIGFDETRPEGEKFYVQDPRSDFDWMELTNYYNYTDIANQLDSTALLNDYDN